MYHIGSYDHTSALAHVYCFVHNSDYITYRVFTIFIHSNGFDFQESTPPLIIDDYFHTQIETQ